jgi:hypothetical protein
VSDSPLHVIVLDDRSRFALHVWRYLSRSVGFGIGDIPRDGELRDKDGEPLAIARPWKLETPAGDAVVWWISARNSRRTEDWKAELNQALAQTESERRLFLVDVRGEPGGPEFWRLAFEALRGQGIAPTLQEVWLVSSYGVGVVPYDANSFPIRPKNSETLQRLAERIWPTREVRPRGTAALKTFHFLVSGAGFELKSRMDPPISPLGAPTTSALLKQSYTADVWQIKSAAPGPEEPDLPLPLPDFAWAHDACVVGARRGLDQLWDSLLEAVLEEAKIDHRREPPSVRKAAMFMAEESARESFRSAFFGDDWGELTQTLDAAAMPWDAWLTTNYTQFVDRAVALLRGSGSGSTPPWRILSIASEAEQLMRQLFFEQRGLHIGRPKERFLFKLHGDLGHLSTMAVAGQDKELFSLTTQTVDHFYWLYDAARAWIEGLLNEKEEARVFWHVVGHGLKDQVLLQTLRQVRDSTSARVRHSFLFVQPEPEAERVFQSLDEETRNWGWLRQPYRADQWMAMLRKYWRIEGRMWTPDDNGGDLMGAVRGLIR